MLKRKRILVVCLGAVVLATCTQAQSIAGQKKVILDNLSTTSGDPSDKMVGDLLKRARSSANIGQFAESRVLFSKAAAIRSTQERGNRTSNRIYAECAFWCDNANEAVLQYRGIASPGSCLEARDYLMWSLLELRVGNEVAARSKLDFFLEACDKDLAELPYSQSGNLKSAEATVLVLLARSFSDTELMPTTRQWLTRAHALAPSNTYISVRLAESLAKAGEYKDAVALLNTDLSKSSRATLDIVSAVRRLSQGKVR